MSFLSKGLLHGKTINFAGFLFSFWSLSKGQGSPSFDSCFSHARELVVLLGFWVKASHQIQDKSLNICTCPIYSFWDLMLKKKESKQSRLLAGNQFFFFFFSFFFFLLCSFLLEGRRARKEKVITLDKDAILKFYNLSIVIFFFFLVSYSRDNWMMILCFHGINREPLLAFSLFAFLTFAFFIISGPSQFWGRGTTLKGCKAWTLLNCLRTTTVLGCFFSQNCWFDFQQQ